MSGSARRKRLEEAARLHGMVFEDRNAGWGRHGERWYVLVLPDPVWPVSWEAHVGGNLRTAEKRLRDLGLLADDGAPGPAGSGVRVLTTPGVPPEVVGDLQRGFDDWLGIDAHLEADQEDRASGGGGQEP